MDQYPKISIVTPSYNQANYIEDTIKSVINQKYPNCEYLIIDGGSTDNTIAIIKEYEKEIDYWVSEPDSGQYDAINKGFERSSGEVMAWINSDDKYTPWALSIVGEIFKKFPEIEWLTTANPLHWDTKGRAISCGSLAGFNSKAFFRGINLPMQEWHTSSWVQQESTFWRRSLWERTGAKINSSYKMAGDFELWAKFFKEANLYMVNCPLGGFRVHNDQKTKKHLQVYYEEAIKILENHEGKIYGSFESKIRDFFFNLFGRRSIPQKYLPKLLQEAFDNLPFVYSVRILKWHSGSWQIERAYLI